MGTKIVLSDTFTDTTLPILYDDSLMSSGSLVLTDFGHSLGGVSGVPAAGATVPNVAWKVANGLVSGAPGQSALSLNVTSNGGINNAAYPLVERTPKLGLHAIRSQTNDLSTSSYWLAFPASIQAYLLANSGHSYYYSCWHNVTRLPASDGTPFPQYAVIGNNTSNFIVTWGQGNVFPNSGAHHLGHAASNSYGGATEATGNSLVQVGAAGATGTLTSFTGAQYQFGGAGQAGGGLHIGPSSILYRTYLEDLTVSGRSYATVAALDLALYNTAFASGGKFYGDTFTAPSGYP